MRRSVSGTTLAILACCAFSHAQGQIIPPGQSASAGTKSSPSYSAVADVPFGPQTLAMATAGNSITITVPAGMGTFEALISGLTASGGTVGFKASGVSGGPYSTFAAQGGSPLGDYTTLGIDGSWTIDTAGHVQIQLVVLTAGTGNVTIAGNFAASIRNMNVRLVTPNPIPAVTTPATGGYSNGGGSLTQANTAQTGIPAGVMTHGGDLVNNASFNEPLCFSVGNQATTGYTNICLAPGISYHFAFPPAAGQTVSVVAASVGHTWTWMAY